MVYLFCLLENGSLASTYGLRRTPGVVICEIRHGMGAIVRVAHRLVARELELTKSPAKFLKSSINFCKTVPCLSGHVAVTHGRDTGGDYPTAPRLGEKSRSATTRSKPWG
jgi:hypothetical protein